MTIVAILGGAALLVCAGLLVGQRRRAQRLEGAVESSAQQLEQLQQAFQHFVPRNVVEDVIQRGLAIRGERRDVTVLFADLAGFTAMSEKLPPEEVVEILNGYFKAMSRAISEHNGHLSKFIGDGLMATFGAPEPNQWQAIDAVRAGLAMLAALDAYNRELASADRPRLRVCIGIHCGPVIAGVIGSSALLEYTVIGDVVNTASRIEGLTRRFDVDLLVSSSIREALDERFVVREMPPLEVKGKTEPLVTFAVQSFDAAPVGA